jgi:hypothetical protein
MGDYQVYQVELRKQTMLFARRRAGKVLDAMQDAARANAAVGPYVTGNLARSIYKTGPHALGYAVTGTIGSRLKYADIVEKGAKIHDIFPKGIRTYRFGKVSRPALKFVWRGKTRYFNQIPGARSTIGRSHPGQPGKHYIRRALVSVAARYNMRVIIYDI